MMYVDNPSISIAVDNTYSTLDFHNLYTNSTVVSAILGLEVPSVISGNVARTTILSIPSIYTSCIPYADTNRLADVP